MAYEEDKLFIDELRRQDYINAMDMLDDLILQNVNDYKEKVRNAIYKIGPEFPSEDNNKIALFLLKELRL
jgi:hypothetical protein